MATRTPTTTNNGNSLAPSVAVPTGAAIDDIAIIETTWDGGSGTLAFTGFTHFTGSPVRSSGSGADGNSFAVMWKRLTAADTGTYSGTLSGISATDWAVTCHLHSGRHTTNPPVATFTDVDAPASGPVTINFASVTALAGDDLVTVSAPDVTASGVGNAHGTLTSYTKQQDVERAWVNLAVYTRDNVSAGATGGISTTFALTGNTASYGSAHIRIPVATAAAPVVTDVDTDESITSTQTNVVITGTGFNTATVVIRQGANTVSQSIDSQTATSIQFDVVFDSGSPDLKYGAATLAVINGDAQEGTIAITIAPPSGKAFVNVLAPHASAPNRITATGLASGDQIEALNAQGGAITDLTLNADGTFDYDDALTAFDARVWDSSDSTWGSVGTQSLAGQIVAVGLVTETDSAFALVATKAKAVGLSTETDSALALTHGRTFTVGLVDETDASLALTFSKAKAVGLADETDSSLTATVVRTYAAGLASETDSAFSLTKLRTYIVGLATESDLALALQGQVVSQVRKLVRRALTLARVMLRRG